MVDPTQDMITVPKKFLSDNVVAVNVSEEDYLAGYEDGRYEWIEGVVIKMSPSSESHDLIVYYLRTLLETYFSFNPIGTTRGENVAMRLAKSFREPDIKVLLNENVHRSTGKHIAGPADICVEVVSPESIERDYGTKYREYQEAGVQEYWLIDPLSQETRFSRLQESGRYASIALDKFNNYHTPLLPKLMVYVPLLWQEKLPNNRDIMAMVEAMVEDKQSE